MKIYISGPITGTNIETTRARFEAAEVMLRRQGFTPVNPMKNGLPVDAPYEEHMKRDLELLAECDAIYLMNGWERSKGCRMEFNAAISANKRITYERENGKRFV